MKKFKDYHDLYLRTDVLLLAAVFEHFRQTCYECYGSDAANYISAPGLAWGAMLLKNSYKFGTYHRFRNIRYD